MGDSISLTEQLQRFSAGDRRFLDPVFQSVFPTLKHMGALKLRNERYRAPVCTVELVDDVWIQHLDKGGWSIRDRTHFYALAGRAMQQVLIDYARRRLAQRRGAGEAPISLDDIPISSMPSVASAEQVVEIGLLTDKLEKVDPDAAQVFRLVHFAGYTLQQIADKTGLAFQETRRRWERGRDWIRKHFAV